VLAVVLPVQPAAAQTARTSSPFLHSPVEHANASGPPCSPVAYNAIVQSPIQKWKDCGASITLPATIHAGPCPTSESRAACELSHQIVIGLSVPGVTLCSGGQMGGQATPGITCLPYPDIQTYAEGPKGPLYGATLSPRSWCGVSTAYCDQTESNPNFLGLYAGGTWPKSFTLYVTVSIVGYYFAVGKITVYSTGSAKPPTPNWLSASIKLATPSGAQLAATAATPGTKLVASVTLAVDAKATGPLTSIHVSPPLTLSPSTVLLSKSGPSPPLPSGGLSINPGSSSTYKMNFVVATAGTVVLSVQANGKGPNSSSQTASDSLTARFGQPLNVKVVWLKNDKLLTTDVNGKSVVDTLRLADGPDAEVPEDITARVVITNTTKVTQENVSLNGVPPFSFATKAQAVRLLPLRVTEGPIPKEKLAKLAPGAHTQVTFTVHVTNNGTFNFAPQVLSSTAGSTATNVSEGTSTLTVLPTKLLWLSLHPLEKGLVSPGTPVLIGGTVSNRSLTEPLNLAPLLATISGNAGGGELIDQKSVVQPDGVMLPFAGELAPGETVDVIGEVGTSLVPGSRAEVSYAPSGTVTSLDGTQRPLRATDIGTRPESSPIAIHLNVSDPPPPPSDLGSIAANFVDSTFFYAAKYSYLGFKGAADAMQHPVDTIGNAAGTIKSVLVTGGYSLADVAHFEASVYLLATVGSSLTLEERQAWAKQVEADYQASHIKIAADKSREILAAVNKAAFNAFVPFQNALQTGNYNQVAALAGQGFGAGLTTAGDLIVSDIIFQKLLIGLGQVPSALKNASLNIRSAVKSQFANDITLASALKSANITQSLGKGLSGIISGQDLLAQGAAALTDIYGLTKSQIVALENFCETNKIIIAVRSRSKRAAQLIRDGLAVGKNEILKIKNVSEIDVAYLGYSSADLNTIVWAEPVPVEYVFAKLNASGAGALKRDIVLQRFYLREFEWVNPKIRTVIEKADAAKQIAWNLDGSGNGATTLIKQQRAFALKSQPSPVSTQQWPAMKNRTYEQVRVGNKPMVRGKSVVGTLLVPVTQDVDLMAILTASGEIVSAELRAKYYEFLSNLIGIEHGETPSWILNGELIFQAKAKILADAIPGGELLAVFGPNRTVTAGFYNPALTTFNNVTKTGRIFFEGGYNSAFYKWQAALKINVSNFAAGL